MYACMYACMYGCVYMHVCLDACTRSSSNRARLILGSAMKRPAGQPVRSSSELDAWLATLHAQAASASDEAVQVHYLGQQYGRADHALYRAHPQDKKLLPGEPRCRDVVRFSWQPRTPQAVPASMTQKRNDDARLRGLTRPRSVPCVSWAARALEIVEQAAKTFVEVHSHALREQIGQQLDCVYAPR